MICKPYILLAFIFLAFLQHNYAQVKPLIEIDQILDPKGSPVIKYTIYDNVVDNIKHKIIVFSLIDETLNIPFSLANFEPTIRTNEQWGTQIYFNEDSLAKYNINLNDIGVKIVAYKPADSANIDDALKLVREADLKQFMSKVEGVRSATANTEHYLKVQNLFDSLSTASNFKNLSYNYPFSTRQGKNLVAAKMGIIEDNSSLLITAHYDTVNGSPGADDNGSGFCALLMALEVLKNYNFENTIKIVGFDDEEIGLIGSINYVNNSIEANENLKGVFNLEMIGYASDEPNTQTLPFGFDLLFPEAANFVAENEFKGNFLNCVGNTASADLIEAYTNAANKYVLRFKVLPLETPGNGEVTQDLRRSDHAPFWDNGYKALMLTDGANFRNPFYHTSNDVSTVLNFEFMANTVKATIATVMEMAKPIVYSEAIGFISDAVIVDTEDFEQQETISINIFGLGDRQLFYYQLPSGIEQANLKFYNFNGQFLESIKLNTNKGRLKLKTNYNFQRFAIVVAEVEGGFKYFTKIISFP